MKNDYNLNISRYVSTAKAEEKVDLLKINNELVSLEENIQKTTLRHNEFLAELGLPLLPLTGKSHLKKYDFIRIKEHSPNIH
ncbi:MAG TPA: hypothetical protein ACHBX0_04680 [Arsenophonus sp.]